MVLDSFFDSMFGSLIAWNPLWALIIISFGITLIITIAYKYLTNQEMMKKLKDDMKDHQKEIKANKDNTEKMIQLQKQIFDKNMKYMMHSLKPTIITFIPLILIFGYLRTSYTSLDLNFLGFISSWIWTYILVSIIASMVLRKLLKVY